MTVKANFIPVLGSLVEPHLKLIISFSGGPEYGKGFRVTHDPEIGPDNLTMPRPANLILTGDSPPFPPVVFESARSKKVTDFVAETSEINSELKVFVHIDPELESRRIARAEISADNPYDLLHAALAASAELPDWDQLASESSRRTITEIGLYISRTAAVQLFSRTAAVQLLSRTAAVQLFSRIDSVQLSRNSIFFGDWHISGDALIVKRKVRR